MQQIFYIIIAALLFILAGLTVLFCLERKKNSKRLAQLRQVSQEAKALQIITEEFQRQKSELEAAINQCSQELSKTKADLDKLLKLTVERELRLAELKKQIKNKEKYEFPENIIENNQYPPDVKDAMLNILEDAREIQKRLGDYKDKIMIIVDNLKDGVIVFDENHVCALINPQAERFLGIASKDFVGKPIAKIEGKDIFNKLVSLLELNPEPQGTDLTLKEKLVVKITEVLSGFTKKRVGSVLILQDVSHEKLSERTKTEFVSLITHQLRTPLSATKWIFKMILEGDVGPVTREQTKWLQKGYLSNERMIRLINDLLEITRIEGGEYLYNPTTTDISAIVESAIDSLVDEARRKGIKLGLIKPQEALPKIKIDAEKIQLAISNILDNALRYTPKGGQVTVSLKPAINGVECEVKDTGIGILSKEQDRIFERFFRGSNALLMETEGTGLGLYISKKIIEAHGGRIQFTSQENKGSAFKFFLPKIRDDA